MYDPKDLGNTLGRKDWDNLVTSFRSALDKAYQAGKSDALKKDRDPSTESDFRELLAEYGLAVMYVEKARASLSRARSENSQTAFSSLLMKQRADAKRIAQEMVDKFVWKSQV